MASLNDLKNRMKSVRDTRKITNAMYLISSAKMRKSRREMEASRPHFYASQAVIGDVLRNLPEIVHPWRRPARENGLTWWSPGIRDWPVPITIIS